ncbi:unnamed protein product [Fusarium graminearum]|uniref:Uncharacterized protein n=1 Tax=Gibberella zeae TaxID=5518 RepID=A0A4U9FA22_GIBZA|nr:unnamed protein product [Fusarium graminearum]
MTFLVPFLPRSASVTATMPIHAEPGWSREYTLVNGKTQQFTTTIATSEVIGGTPIELTNVLNAGATVPTITSSNAGGDEQSSLSTNTYITLPSDSSLAVTEIATTSTEDASTGSTPSNELTGTSEVSETGTRGLPSKGLSDGAVAGVAIACIIAGVAIGLVAAFILFRRRLKSTNSSPGFITLESRHVEPKNEPQVNVVASTHDAELEQFLLEATPDKEIQAELRSLSELIYQHVETYYHGPQVLASSAEVAQCIVHIGYSAELSGLQAEAVAAVCLAPRTSRVGLRHVLSHTIFRRLDFNSGGDLSMLPPVIAAMAQEESTPEHADSPAISLARSKWRSLSALLLHPNPAERTPLPLSMDEAPAKAQSLANELNTFLQLFVAQDSARRQDQTNHLQDVILECTRLGYVLLSQPGDWGFVFEAKTTPKERTRRIVVCPGLERLSHNNGTRYGSPKEVAAAETMSL